MHCIKKIKLLAPKNITSQSIFLTMIKNPKYRELIEQTFDFPQKDFRTEKAFLVWNGLPLMDIIEKYGSPLRITYLPKISQQIQKARRLFNSSIANNDYRGDYNYCYCTKSSHFSFVLEEALKNKVHLETSSAFDFDLIKKLEEKKKIKKENYIICNGFKPQNYIDNIIEAYKSGYKNIIPILDNLDELEKYNKLNEPMNIGMRIAAEEEPKYEFYTSRLGIRYNDIVPFYQQKIQNNPNYKLKMLHFFIDTGIKDVNYYWTEFHKALEVYCDLKKVCPELTAINLGGGMPIKHSLAADFDYEYMINEIVTQIKSTSNYSRSSSVTNATALNLNTAEEPTSTYNSLNRSNGFSYMINNNIAYTKKFDSTDRQLDVNVGHSYVASANDVILNSMAYDSTGVFVPANSQHQTTSSPGSLQNVVIKLDYVHPLRKLTGYKIEAGFKSETTINKNVFNDYNVVNNTPQFDTLLSNKLKYSENVAAAYGIFRGTYKKWWSYSVGLRIEQTYINGNDHAISQDYVDFFPSASMAFVFNDTQNLSISYTRRIQRPPFRFINNAITYTDQFTIWQGNPLLQPSFSNNINLAYSHSILKHYFSLKAGGTFVTNGFTGIATVDSNRITRSTEVNGVNSKSCVSIR